MAIQGSQCANHVSALNSASKLHVNQVESSVHPMWVRTPMITEPLGDKLSAFEKKHTLLEPQAIADAVAKQLLSGSSGQLIIPTNYNYASGVRGWASWVQQVLRHGVNKNISLAKFN